LLEARKNAGQSANEPRFLPVIGFFISAVM